MPSSLKSVLLAGKILFPSWDSSVCLVWNYWHLALLSILFCLDNHVLRNHLTNLPLQSCEHSVANQLRGGHFSHFSQSFFSCYDCPNRRSFPPFSLSGCSNDWSLDGEAKSGYFIAPKLLFCFFLPSPAPPPTTTKGVIFSQNHFFAAAAVCALKRNF